MRVCVRSRKVSCVVGREVRPPLRGSGIRRRRSICAIRERIVLHSVGCGCQCSFILAKSIRIGNTVCAASWCIRSSFDDGARNAFFCSFC